MRIKHLLQLKQNHNPPTWKNIATYWLALDLHKISKCYHILIANNRMKTINNKRPFYYQDTIYYIKNENTKIQKIQNPTTKNIYQEIIEHGLTQYKIAGEILWKKLLPTLDFRQIWKNTYFSYAQPFRTDLHYKLLHYSTKTNEYMHKCTNDINPHCNCCQQIENNIHLFIKRPRINKI